MALSVLNNIASLTAQNNLSVTNSNLQNTLFQLSSGSRINSGADDPAGLSIADGLQANITALTQSSQNATDGVGQLQVADGALSQVTTLLNRAVTLATEAANGGLTSDQYGSITTEYGSILSEINRIGNATNFNGNAVFGSTNQASANQLLTTATGNLSTNTVLTSGKTTTVQLGNGAAYTYTAGQNASTLVSANGSLTTGTALAAGDAITLTNTSGAHTYTASNLSYTGATTGLALTTNLTGTSGATTADNLNITLGNGSQFQLFSGTATGSASTIGEALQSIDTAGAAYGVSAYLNGSNQLTIQVANGGSVTGVTANAGFTSDFGAVSGVVNTDTVGDIMNQINGASNTTGMTASLSGGHLQITSANGSITASANSMTPAGALNGTNTIQDLINGINSSGLGVTAGIQTVAAQNLNQLIGSGSVQGTTTITDGDTLTITSGTKNTVTGAYPNTYIYKASSSTPDSVANTTGNDTVQGLVDSINNSGTTFHAFLDTAGNLQITDSSYSGNISATGSVSNVTGNLAVASATTQLAITDAQNRNDLTVTNNDATFGYVANANGIALEGGNTNSFAAPSISGSSGANVFISDGNVTNPQYNTISVAVGKLSTTQIGNNTTTLAAADLSTSTGASSALTVINSAISDVAAMRGTISAGINRLNSATNVINTQIQNLTSAQSSIQDANVGQVVASLSKYQILEQTGISALAQANQNQQSVLKLLQ